MADIFGYKRAPKPDGVFSSEDSMMVIGGAEAGSANTPSLVQNWNVEYTQDVQELFELGSNKLFWAKGRPVGRGSIGRIVGQVGPDTAESGLMPKSAFDICDGGATLMIKAVGGHCQTTATRLNKGVTLVMSGVVVTSIGFAMTVQDVRIMENYGWRFAHLQLTGT